MPSGAKKRKALKKKKQEQESTSNNNTHGNDEQGSQDDRDSDGSLSSPGSQGNGELWTRDPSPSPLSGLRKVTVKEETEDADFTRGQEAKSEQDVITVGRGTDQEEENGMDNSEISPALDSVKPVGSLVSKKNEQAASLIGSDSIKEKSDENEEKHRLKEGNIPGSAVETSKEIKNVKETEVPECSEEKSLLPSGPPVVRTSWLSCCGLFDAMAGSER